MKAIASAMSSAEVKVLYGLSGFASRICGVRIALMTRMFAVAAESAAANWSASASVQLSAAALVAAVGGVGAGRGLRLGGGDEHEAAVLARGERLVEGPGRVDHGAHEQVVQPLVVGERRGRERLAAPPAADQVQEPVDAAEALAERAPPSRGRRPRRAGRRPGRRCARRAARARRRARRAGSWSRR